MKKESIIETQTRVLKEMCVKCEKDHPVRNCKDCSVRKLLKGEI